MQLTGQVSIATKRNRLAAIWYCWYATPATTYLAAITEQPDFERVNSPVWVIDTKGLSLYVLG
jgi:hypothetical protein